MSKYNNYIITAPKPAGQDEPPKDGADVMTPITYIDERIIPKSVTIIANR